MPVGFLSDEQANRYGRFLGDPTQDQLARHFHLDDADRAFVGEHRGDHNRLGVAVQLGSIRLLGTFLEDPALTPASVVRFAGDQLAMTRSSELMAMYVASAGNPNVDCSRSHPGVGEDCVGRRSPKQPPGGKQGPSPPHQLNPEPRS